jgi:PAS domain S-box-containing protein
MNKNIKNDFSIVIIDNVKEFNNKLTKYLQIYDYTIVQFFTIKDGLRYILDDQNRIDLLILNIDFIKEHNLKVSQFLEQRDEINTILISKEDRADKREEYFKRGILDYYLSSKKVEHIAKGIYNTIQKLTYNKKETILLIDGSKQLCSLLQFLLQKRSYNVLSAQTAKEGIEILKENEVTLLILDMELPDVYGLEILETLEDLYLFNDFLVMTTSKNANPSLIRDALKGGASNYMKKPFLYEEFLLQTDILAESSRSRKLITQQKQKIEHSLQSFKELVNSSINMMFVFKKNICVDCNNEAVKLLEYGSKGEIVGKDIQSIFSTVSNEHYENLIEDTTDHYFEDKMESQKGKWYDVQVKERNIYIGGKLLKIIAAMDISDIKRNNKIISQQSKMASMGEMIGNIAHQWRQPLTAISVAASGIKLNYELEMEDRDETIKELENIVQNTQFLSTTIEDFQNFLKNDRTKTQFFIQNTIEKTLAIIQANIESHEIDIIQEYEQDHQIEGIQNDLVQILLNIINNAVDILKVKEAGVKRKILIKVSYDEEFSIISIQDSGGGIPEDIADKIFEPYFTTKHQSRGTGLGLYMTHQIIEKIGGTLEVSNSSFTIEGEEFYGAKFLFKAPLVFIN